MRKIKIAILICISVCSCNNSKPDDFKVIKYSTKPDVFKVIDYTSWGDIPEVTSIKIYKSGKVYIFNYDQTFKIDYYSSIILSEMELDTLCKLAGNVLKLKLDTLYHSLNCDRCICYNLIIKTDNLKFHTSFSGQASFRGKTKPLDSLARNIQLLIRKYRDENDSVFKFESRPIICEPKYICPQPKITKN